MFSIGDLARVGGVSVRMLRHYDDIGLLKPLRVDQRNAYRSYGTDELHRLRRIVAFRELGFPLAQISALLEESITSDQLRGMLRMRRSQIAQEISAHEERLRHLEHLITSIEVSEQESNMPTKLADDAVQRRVIPAITVARCSAVAAGFGPQIGPVLSPLFPQLFSVLATAGVGTIAPPLSLYEDHEDGAIKVSAAAQIDPSAAGQIGADTGLEVVMLPEIDAVTSTYVGAMATIGEAYEALFAWIAEHGLKTLGYSREAAIHCPSDPNEWITELQVPVVSLS